MFALTPRLTLRPPWPEEGPAIARAIGHKAVVTRLGRAPWPYTVADGDDFARMTHAQGEPALLIVTREVGVPEIIGCIGIHRENVEYELGYWLTPSAWGRGYATEAGRQVIAIARDALGLRRLDAVYHQGNHASARVLAKLGFRATGAIERRPCRALGRDVDAVVMSLELANKRRLRMAA